MATASPDEPGAGSTGRLHNQLLETLATARQHLSRRAARSPHHQYSLLLHDPLRTNGLWLDGACGWQAGKGPARFAAAAEVTDGVVARLVRVVRDRVVRALRRRGKLRSAAGGGDVDSGADADEVQAGQVAAAVQGRAAVGERAGERDVRVGRSRDAAPFVKAPLCAECDGFSLHAAVVVAARDRERLEKLCRLP